MTAHTAEAFSPRWKLNRTNGVPCMYRSNGYCGIDFQSPLLFRELLPTSLHWQAGSGLAGERP